MKTIAFGVPRPERTVCSMDVPGEEPGQEVGLAKFVDLRPTNIYPRTELAPPAGFRVGIRAHRYDCSSGVTVVSVDQSNYRNCSTRPGTVQTEWREPCTYVLAETRVSYRL